MAINNNSNKNTRKNTYKKDDSIKPKHNRIKGILTRKKYTERKENTYINKQQMQIFLKSALGILLALFIFGAIAWGCIAAYNYATESEYFEIKEIKYSGNKFLTNTELAFLTKLELNKNILTYKIKQIEAQLLESPWIDNVKIKRSLPNKISIDIKEKEPIFWATRDDTLYYLDKHTNFIAPVTEDKFVALPTIDIKYADEEAIKSLPDFIDKFKDTDFPFSINEILWLSMNHEKGYEMYLEKYNLNISIAIENWEKNITNLAAVMRDLKKRNEINRIKEIRATPSQVTILKN